MLVSQERLGEVDNRTIAAAGKKQSAARQKCRQKPEPVPAEKKILLIEDEPLTSKIISRSISASLGFDVISVDSYEEADRMLSTGTGDFMAAVTDLSLPDAPDGEIINLTNRSGVPTLVFTGTFDEKIRASILARNVVDYHVKGLLGLEGINRSLKRLDKNPAVKVLVVDDSRTIRTMVTRLLKAHLFQVIEARDGAEGYALLEENPDTALVLTDCEMPHMDGIEMTHRIMSSRCQKDLVVIGISSLGTAVSARFLKNGANDFLSKPFQKEEFYCRIYRCLETMEHIKTIKRAAFTDKLTGLSNRLHFFKIAPPLYETAIKEEIPFAVAMMDIDFFKSVNDTYGHAGGDLVLEEVARILRDRLPGEVITARFGGEEFCCFAPGTGRDEAVGLFEGLRAAVEEARVSYNGRTIKFTISIGLSFTGGSTIDDTINRADENLYLSKDGGRNLVTAEPAGTGERVAALV